MGRDFIEKVVDARWKDGRGATTNDETLAEDLEFRCHLRGWNQPEREQRIDKLLSKQLLSNGDRTQRQQADAKLMQALLDSEPPILIFFPRDQFPEDTPPGGEDGWWYKARRTGLIRRCGRCWLQKWLDHFPSEMHSAAHTKPECYECQAARNKERLEEETEGPIPGLLSVTADPRLVGRKDDPSGGDIIVDGPGLRYLLGFSKSRKAEHMELWLTTRQMGFAVVREEDEIDDPEAEWTGEPTGRYLAPQASAFIQTELESVQRRGAEQGLLEALQQLEDTWGKVEEPSPSLARTQARNWETPSAPLASKDPPLLPEVDIERKLGRDWFLNEALPHAAGRQGYVRVWADAQRWHEQDGEDTIMVGEGMATLTRSANVWAIPSAQWYFLKDKFQTQLAHQRPTTLITQEVAIQHQHELEGLRNFSWRLLRALMNQCGAKVMIGGSALAAPPFFKAMGRGLKSIWGKLEGPAVVLWDYMSPEERQQWRDANDKSEGWILIHRKRKGKSTTGTSDPSPPGVIWHTLKRGGTAKEPRKGRAMRELNWWRRGSVDLCENAHTMICRVSALTDASKLDAHSLEQAWFDRRGKDDLCMRHQDEECRFWLGTEAGALGAYGFPGRVVATDGSENRGRMGAGYWELSRQPIGECWEEVPGEEIGERRIFQHAPACSAMAADQCPEWQSRLQLEQAGAEDGDLITDGQRYFSIGRSNLKGYIRVGREEEGASSLRPELAAIECTLQQVSVAEPLLILSDCKLALTEIQKWVGEGLKPCMELVKDADIMRSLIERLRVRIQQGSPTFLVKIKSHRGEPLNERADEEAGKGCRLEAEVKQWDAPTSRILYAWESDLGVKRQVPWGPSVRKMITKRAGRARVAMEYQASHRAWLKGWWQASDWSGLSPDETGRRHIEANWWATQSEWEQAGAAMCKHNRGMQLLRRCARPASRTWTTDFLLRPRQSRMELHKWLTNKAIPWRRRRRLLQVISHSYPSGAFLYKIGRRAAKHCTICSRLHPDRPLGQIAPETTGHILSAWCAGQAEAATGLHNKGVRLILKAAVPPDADPDKLVVLTEDGEHTMDSLWAKKEISCLCGWSEVFVAAQQARRRRLQHDTLVDRESQAEQSICDHCGQEGCEQQRSEDAMGSICCHCQQEMTTVQGKHMECATCWGHRLPSQRFDGVIIDRRNNPKKLVILEFKRRIDTMEEYWQKGKEAAEAQYADLLKGIVTCMPPGWVCTFVPVVVGSSSIPEEEWDKAMAALGVPKTRGTALRAEMMRVMLDGQDSMLRGYRAQLAEA